MVCLLYKAAIKLNTHLDFCSVNFRYLLFALPLRIHIHLIQPLEELPLISLFCNLLLPGRKFGLPPLHIEGLPHFSISLMCNWA